MQIERRLREQLRRASFPFAASADPRGAQWRDESLVHAKEGAFPVGPQRHELARVAVGSLLKHANVARKLDGALGVPPHRVQRELIEVELTLRFGAPAAHSAPDGIGGFGGESTDGAGGGGRGGGGRGGGGRGASGAGRKRKADS